MKRVLFALALLGVAVGGANADPAVLEGGALIAHYDPMYIWSDAPCDDYYMYPLTTCDDQINRVDTMEFVEITWYAIADFDEEKVWCGCQFGFSAYHPDVAYFLNWSPCYPPDGGLEIASSGWPGPDEGTAIVVTGAPWEGDMVPQYAFNSYVYGYAHLPPDVLQFVPDPSVANPFGGFGNCASPPEKWDAQLGGLGINMDGTWVCAEPPVYDYVCCVGEDCVIVHSEQECIDLGGEFHPEWDNCGPPNPCEVLAACCLEGVCTITNAAQCEAIGGEWHPEWPECEPNPCPPFGACCFDCDCVLMYEEACLQAGGIFVGGPCDPNPCPGSPTEITSWGSIKSLYR